MVYSNMNTTSKNMRLSPTELGKMVREQQEELYASEQEKQIKEQCAVDRAREEYYSVAQNNIANEIAATNNRAEFLQNVKESFVTECIMKLFTESVAAPMTSNDKIIARNLVTRFVKDNGAGDLIVSFATKNLLLSEMSRISQKYYDRVVRETLELPRDGIIGAGLLPPDKDDTRPSGTKPWEVKDWKLDQTIADDFYDELKDIDCTDASKNSRPASSNFSLTAPKSDGSVVISYISSSAEKSSAPASNANIIISSSDISVDAFSITITPFLLNIYDTHPVVPRLPPAFENTCLTSAAVLFLLSVAASTISATPHGPYPSYVISS